MHGYRGSVVLIATLQPCICLFQPRYRPGEGGGLASNGPRPLTACSGVLAPCGDVVFVCEGTKLGISASGSDSSHIFYAWTYCPCSLFSSRDQPKQHREACPSWSAKPRLQPALVLGDLLPGFPRRLATERRVLPAPASTSRRSRSFLHLL